MKKNTFTHNIVMLITLFCAFIPAAGFWVRQEVLPIEFAIGNMPVVAFAVWVLVETIFHIKDVIRAYKEFKDDDMIDPIELVWNKEKSNWVCTIIVAAISLFANICIGAKFGDSALICMYTFNFLTLTLIAWTYLRFMIFACQRVICAIIDRRARRTRIIDDESSSC